MFRIVLVISLLFLIGCDEHHCCPQPWMSCNVEYETQWWEPGTDNYIVIWFDLMHHNAILYCDQHDIISEYGMPVTQSDSPLRFRVSRPSQYIFTLMSHDWMLQCAETVRPIQ
jgi:hypothetical protein